MTDTDTQVASGRTVVSNPLIDDPNAGIIVAAGDPLPSGLTGVVSNTPNKVDAAANYDEVDAADKANAGRPATVVVQGGEGVDPEIAARVAANRSNWFGEQDVLAKQAASPDPSPAEKGAKAADRGSDARTTAGDVDVTAENVDKATGKAIDAQFGDAEGYPGARASVADKRAFARTALEAGA